MSATSVRSLLNQLTGHEVRVFIKDGKITGRVGALTDELLVLAADDDVVWVDLDQIQAVRAVNHGSDHDDDE